MTEYEFRSVGIGDTVRAKDWMGREITGIVTKKGKTSAIVDGHGLVRGQMTTVRGTYAARRMVLVKKAVRTEGSSLAMVELAESFKKLAAELGRLVLGD